MILDDFEEKSDTVNWTGSVSRSKEFPAHGSFCLRISGTEGQSSWCETRHIPGDWSNFDLLKFDIYNPSERLCYGTLQIYDEKGTDEQAEFQGQSYMGEDKLFLNTGWNHFEFLLHHAMVEEGDRPLILQKIRKLRFSFGITDKPVYLDNIRLVKGQENLRNMSRTNPYDCRIIIDNRAVYPILAGPVDQIKPRNEILHLRKQAADAIRELRNAVGVLELQGYQTLYQRIPLITADIGVGIRSRLVWFQNEKEEKKILEYVISSCNKTTGEITDFLTNSQSNVATVEPENDVANASFFVPPLPPLNELKPVDGVYRDKDGHPVILFSMLQVDNGPLMDYFAPFNHRLESYTVGGGSRYNIESSPVYEAFHKYPDTHRVGWDGWCGHLIKDRWSMGGKKEDVVICLESPHIREAVLEYIKIHYREWTGNPNLLYNIMAYELQYICYCDKSQQMFRVWLQSEYSNIHELNKIWQTGYRSFNEIMAPETRNTRPPDDVNRAAWLDWSAFNARRFTDYMKWIKSEMRKLDPATPICAGGTSSMLSSSNSVTGIDEEMIINEIDDVILNESGSSVIFSDLLLSLSGKRKVMVDPEMGGNTHGLLLQFLHGKSDISKWWWAGTPSKEFPHMNETSLPHSKEISLSDIDEVLRLALDVRRLSSEIKAFTRPDPEVLILYSKTSILQVPPGQIQSGATPYIQTLYNMWEGSRFLGCRIGFISENQIVEGLLSKTRLLLIPAVKYIRPEVVASVEKYLENGGNVVMVPESFVFDQYARENDRITDFGIKIREITLPPVIGKAEKEQNYDQSFSQAILYGEVRKKITCENEDLFAGHAAPLTLESNGLVQNIDPGNNKVLAHFDDGKAAIVHIVKGKGSLYYLASPLKTADYHLLLTPLAKRAGLKRPVTGTDKTGNLVTGAEVRSADYGKDFLVYASNLGSEPVEFDLKGTVKLGNVLDLRSLKEIKGGHVALGPFQETIFRVEKLK
jgi:hypothetical protein